MNKGVIHIRANHLTTMLTNQGQVEQFLRNHRKKHANKRTTNKRKQILAFQ